MMIYNLKYEQRHLEHRMIKDIIIITHLGKFYHLNQLFEK